MANRKQLTVVWHVDDLKISHVNPKVVDKFLEWLTSKYRKLRKTRGKVHEYLGMKLDFLSPSKMKVSMKEYIQESIDEFQEELGKAYTSPAADHLFQVNEEGIRYVKKGTAISHNCSKDTFFVQEGKT
eukprot:8999136-Ditylum_brightwellii.AAC.1